MDQHQQLEVVYSSSRRITYIYIPVIVEVVDVAKASEPFSVSSRPTNGVGSIYSRMFGARR